MADGKVRYVFRNFPVLGERSVRAAMAAECAAEQDRFWEYHDALFEAGGRKGSAAFTDEGLIGLAGEVGLEVDQFRRCLAAGRTRVFVQADLQYGRSLGVHGTPTIFIDGKPYSGVMTFDFYSARIEEALSRR